ncbi:putative F-box domain, leucine-rich repeat domain superfamily, F-box-like domain superfamily [Helianthus anomalus]
MDRISELPEYIAHHILSFCNTSDAPPAELVRMSVLSKTWFHLTASFPILNFKIDNFRSRDSFFKYVEYTTSRFYHQDLTAYRFRIKATLEAPAELDIVNRCLELLLKKGVTKLVIDITNSSESVIPKYRLPNILLSVSVLKYLTIRGCDLPSSLLVDALKFKSLIYLELEHVYMDEEAIKYLTASCPLLQVLRVFYCHGFKRFCVYGHQNLQSVTIYSDSLLEKIDIEAPKLCRLVVLDYHRRGPPQITLASCKKLRTVAYCGYPLANSNGFTDFLSNLQFIKKLVLVTKYKYNNLKLSSNSLRTLVLNLEFDLEEIEFSTPNLDLFIYSCDPWYIRHATSHLPHLKACMRCYPDGSIDTLWFQRLRIFLDKKNGFKALNLYINTKQKFIVLENLKAIELPPYELEHIELHFEHEESSDYAAFVDAVLWCCRPRSLSLRSSFSLTDFEEQSDLVKYTYRKLLEQEDQSRTIVQIVSPSSSKARKQFWGLMPLLGGSLREEKAISFIKEEGTLFMN